MVNLHRIRRIIISNVDKPFGVKELAEVLGMSESHLRDSCYEKCQMSPGLIIETIHLEITLKLLADNRLRIYEVCRRAGYRNLKTFRNAFKRRLNMTPKEFRQNSAKTDGRELMKILWGDHVEMFR
jgi:AraC-like DNA-binding protein